MWRQAEEIARIADNLRVPEQIEAFIEREAAGRDRPPPEDPAAGPISPATGDEETT